MTNQVTCRHNREGYCFDCDSEAHDPDELQAANDILERETIIAKLAAKATAGNGWYIHQASYEQGYRDALSRLWNSTGNVEDVIRTLARL